MNSLVLKSPAKLNLYLDVLRKRPDGYHDIETIFERIDLFDRITLAKIPFGIRITSNRRDLPLDQTNLAYRAASLIFRGKAKGGVRIHLHKRIPVAAGLGGGSSNAATVLMGLNRLYHFRIPFRKLLSMGETLGSDVPFFLYQTPFAIGRKKGDQIVPVRSSLKMLHLIVNNRVKVLTKEVYQQVSFTLTKKSQGAKIFQHFIEKKDLNGLIENCYNALEAPAIKGYPGILKIKETLKAHGVEGATLSGSGPTVFGFARSLSQAKALRKAILSKYDWDVFICSTY